MTGPDGTAGSTGKSGTASGTLTGKPGGPGARRCASSAAGCTRRCASNGARCTRPCARLAGRRTGRPGNSGASSGTGADVLLQRLLRRQRSVDGPLGVGRDSLAGAVGVGVFDQRGYLAVLRTADPDPALESGIGLLV